MLTSGHRDASGAEKKEVRLLLDNLADISKLT
jgi:hypothetical protein